MAYDIKDIKTTLTGISHSITGIKGDITGLKGDVEGVKAAMVLATASVQLLKVDLSLFKIDEKGISYRGVQKHTWSGVKKAEEEKKEKQRREYDARYYLQSHANGLHKGIKKAQETAKNAQNDVRRLKDTLRSAGQSAAFPSTKNKREEFNSLRNSARNLSQALAGI